MLIRSLVAIATYDKGDEDACLRFEILRTKMRPMAWQ
jgi:hypothetical protein